MVLVPGPRSGLERYAGSLQHPVLCWRVMTCWAQTRGSAGSSLGSQVLSPSEVHRESTALFLREVNSIMGVFACWVLLKPVAVHVAVFQAGTVANSTTAFTFPAHASSPPSSCLPPTSPMTTSTHTCWCSGASSLTMTLTSLPKPSASRSSVMGHGATRRARTPTPASLSPCLTVTREFIPTPVWVLRGLHQHATPGPPLSSSTLWGPVVTGSCF